MKRDLSMEIRNAIVYLERQPGVASVVQGRYVRARHRHKPGFARIGETDAKMVRLRVYDKDGTKELIVHAPASPQRDHWLAEVAALNGGPVEHKKSSTSLPLRMATVAPAQAAQLLASVKRGPIPAPVDEKRGKLFDVTPDMAAQWLEKNTRNRPLRYSVVQKYAADMRAGKWMVTGDAIAFDTGGSVINGQHRLWAVLESGKTIQMLVVFNLEPEVVAVLDDHLKRNLKDVMHISRPGITMTNDRVACARMMQMASIAATAVDKAGVIAKLTRQEQMDFYDRHSDAIEFTIREVFKNRKVRGLTPSPVLGAVSRAYYTQDKDRLKRFGEVLMTGLAEASNESAAIILRNWLLGMQIEGRATVRMRSDTVYRKASRALLSFCQGQRLTKLFEASEELFPLPEDTMPKRHKAS